MSDPIDWESVFDDMRPIEPAEAAVDVDPLLITTEQPPPPSPQPQVDPCAGLREQLRAYDDVSARVLAATMRAVSDQIMAGRKVYTDAIDACERSKKQPV